MESLTEKTWDVVISGTGLQQSLLALALSRSGKSVLHVDRNDYYGQHEAAFSLQEVENWIAVLGEKSSPSTEDDDTVFEAASITKPDKADADGLSFPRAYSLALAPQIIHTKSKLVEQLVSSRAYRSLELQAVGSFYILQGRSLTRIPSSREDVFSTKDVPARSKRLLMKFLKFVLEYETDTRREIWEPQKEKSLSSFLSDEFNLDSNLRTYIMALTLSLDGEIIVADGLATIHRHLTSFGVFGPGFCALYPKWGGLSEVAQVACRAGAVGGGIYMLGTSLRDTKASETTVGETELKLSNDVVVKTKAFVSSRKEASSIDGKVSRLVAIVSSPLSGMFESTAEGAPNPAVSIVFIPATIDGAASESGSKYPVFAILHSHETGECPKGQSMLYLSTLTATGAKDHLEAALNSVLASTASEETPKVLYKVYYEQACGFGQPTTDGTNFTFPLPSTAVAFDDDVLDHVKQAWLFVMGDDAVENEYMQFPDREGVGDDDEDYE